MTGIYQKSNGKYLAQFRDRGRKQNWKEFKTLAEARRWRAIRDPRSVDRALSRRGAMAGLP
jgi:hypothetical protein